jgi:hypothetical protein
MDDLANSGYIRQDDPMGSGESLKPSSMELFRCGRFQIAGEMD